MGKRECAAIHITAVAAHSSSWSSYQSHAKFSDVPKLFPQDGAMFARNTAPASMMMCFGGELLTAENLAGDRLSPAKFSLALLGWHPGLPGFPVQVKISSDGRDVRMDASI